MKKYIVGIALLGCLSTPVLAQTEPTPPEKETEKDDKVDKLKIAYITTELNLTTAEAEKFWPIYNECEAKIKELRKANREIQKTIDEGYDALTNEEAKKKMESIFENDTKEIATRKEYAAKFSALLGDKRALKLLSLEHEFKKELLNALKDHHGGPGGPHNPPPHHKENGGK